MQEIHPTNFIITALDFFNQEEALRIVDILDDKISFYKVGMQLYFSAGQQILQELNHRNKQIFLDLKLNDIPATIKKAVHVLSQNKVDVISVFTNADGVKAAKQASLESTKKIKIINITVLTSENFDDVTTQVLQRTELSLKAGADGIVCSGIETSLLRKEFGDDFLIINPGIRPVGIQSNDQKRIVTPSQAYQNKASHVVIGRPITQSSNVLKTVKEIQNSIFS